MLLHRLLLICFLVGYALTIPLHLNSGVINRIQHRRRRLGKRSVLLNNQRECIVVQYERGARPLDPDAAVFMPQRTTDFSTMWVLYTSVDDLGGGEENNFMDYHVLDPQEKLARGTLDLTFSVSRQQHAHDDDGGEETFLRLDRIKDPYFEYHKQQHSEPGNGNAKEVVPNTRLMVYLHPGVPEEELVTVEQLFHGLPLDRVSRTALTDRQFFMNLAMDMTAVRRHQILEQIASHPQVMWIETEQAVRTTNRWSVVNIQSGGDFDTCAVPGCTPLWEAGLRGQGMLLGMSDTGLQYTQCYFRNTGPVTSEPPIASGGNCGQSQSSQCRPPDNGNEKVRVLWALGDTIDNTGHGTHVAGSAVGEIVAGKEEVSETTPLVGLLRAEEFNGMAPHTKLVFADIQRGNSGSLIVPQPMGPRFLNFFLEMGTRFHSGSWGASNNNNGYTAIDEQVDRFTWEHKEFLSIFAAGNDGSGLNCGSIASPGQAKNALTVCASMNTVESIETGGNSGHTGDIYDTTPPPESLNPHDRGEWVADFSSLGPTGDGRIKPDVCAPGGSWTWSASLHSESDTCDSLDTMIGGQRGTSMATPKAAAAAVQVDEYCQRGMYPGGEPASGPSFVASAAMIKAILIHSGQRMRGYHTHDASDIVDRGTNYVTASSFDHPQFDDKLAPHGRLYIEGHGRLALDRVLLLKGINDNQGWRTWLYDDFQDEVTLSFMGESSYPLTATLVWTDYPGSCMSGSKQLVNDLDLVLTKDDTPEVMEACVNNLRGNASDHTNNVEKLVGIQLEQGVWYRLSVRAYDVPMGPQPYALVITGPAQMTISQLGEDTPSSTTASSSSVVDPLVLVSDYRDDLCFNRQVNASRQTLREKCCWGHGDLYEQERHSEGGECLCDDDWTGKMCSHRHCSGNGNQATDTDDCVCNDGWQGWKCSYCDDQDKGDDEKWVCVGQLIKTYSPVPVGAYELVRVKQAYTMMRRYNHYWDIVPGSLSPTDGMYYDCECRPVNSSRRVTKQTASSSSKTQSSTASTTTTMISPGTSLALAIVIFAVLIVFFSVVFIIYPLPRPDLTSSSPTVPTGLTLIGVETTGGVDEYDDDVDDDEAQDDQTSSNLLFEVYEE